jgi:hypothetical protein
MRLSSRTGTTVVALTLGTNHERHSTTPFVGLYSHYAYNIILSYEFVKSQLSNKDKSHNSTTGNKDGKNNNKLDYFPNHFDKGY